MRLTRFCLQYVSQRDLSKEYRDTLMRRCSALQAFTGKSSTADNFKHETVNAFLQQLTELSPYTVTKYRQDFLCVWRAAADADLVPYPTARRLWRPKRHQLIIECLDHREVSAIVEAAEKLPGAFREGLPKRHYWSALIRAAWDTGLRRGDLFRLTLSMVKKDGTFKIAQSKTGKVVTCTLKPSTVDKLRQAGGSLEYQLCLRSFSITFALLVKNSGINRHATFKQIRRGVGSLVESLQPGAGCKALGNTEQVFRLHYDAQLRPVDLPQTPELETA